MNEVLLFALAVTAARYGIEVHAYCVLSNHFHFVVTDTQALLPRFQQDFNALVARAINASLGRTQTFWAPPSYSGVWVVAPEDVVSKAAYTLANPVAAGLVRHAKLWPGLWSAPEQFGTTLEIARPAHFFASDGDLPATATLTLTAPPSFSSVEEFREEVVAALVVREQTARSERARFLGVAGVLLQSPFSRPKAREQLGTLNPRVAAQDKWKRIDALAELVAFVRAYRVAWTARRAGRTDVLFPAGTYLLRVAHGVLCVT